MIDDTNTQVVSADPEVELVLRESYDRLLPQYLALKQEELLPINIDIPSMVTTVLGATPEILAYAPRMVALPEFDFDQVKDLKAYAQGLSRAHTLFMTASTPSNDFLAKIQEGTDLRDTLFADATSLLRRNVLDSGALKDYKGITGFKNLAFDLQILAEAFKVKFDKLESKILTTRKELDRAEQLGAEILDAVGLREQGPASITATTDIRARAFTLLSHVYDQARRGLLYLRHSEDDVDTIAPSLFAGRGGRKKASPDSPPPAAAPSPVSLVPSPGSAATTPAPAPVAGAHTTTTGSKAPGSGSPNSDPFMT